MLHNAWTEHSIYLAVPLSLSFQTGLIANGMAHLENVPFGKGSVHNENLSACFHF